MKGTEVRFVDRLAEDRVIDLVSLYRSSTWWATQRELADVERMLAGSDVVVGAIDQSSDRLVGFARAVTDGVYLAIVLDVIVATDHRGQGLGRYLMEEILARPEIRSVDSVELVCQPELVPFYERWGFTDRIGRSLLMRRTAKPKLVAPA